jgi:PAS domain S-box-containing protein
MEGLLYLSFNTVLLMTVHPPKSSPDSFLATNEVSNLLFDNIDETFLFIDKDLNIVFANKRALRSLKEFLGRDIYPGQNITSLVSNERQVELKRIYQDVFNGNERKTEVNMPSGDGFRYFENVLKPARNPEGQIVGVIVSSREITEKKYAEKALSEAEERWRFALESANQGVWDWNIKTGISYYSKSYLDLYGYSEGDLSGSFSEWQDRVHPEDLGPLMDTVKRQLEKKEKYVETVYRIKVKTGEYKWIEAKGMLLLDAEGNPDRMIGLHTDLTQKLKTQEELERTNQEIRVANERFNIMMKATHDMIWDWDLVNDNFYRGEEGLMNVYGIQSHNAISTIEHWLQRIHPADFRRVERVIRAIKTDNKIDKFDLEYRFRRDDGSYSFVYDRGLIIRNEQQVPIRVIGAAQDISERKRLESEILKNEIEYQKTISQASIDSQEMERTAIGKELHDNVNQILTTTKLYLDLARTKPELKDELIKKSIYNINDIINEIRNLSRSLMDPTINDLGIGESITGLVENINLLNQIHVTFNFDENLETVLNKNQKLTIFRIIQEAINNVLRHAEAKKVVINLHRKDDKVELLIDDDGKGFTPDMVKKGIGLNNIKNRISLINGSVDLKSEPDKGCQLIINFPIH